VFVFLGCSGLPSFFVLFFFGPVEMVDLVGISLCVFLFSFPLCLSDLFHSDTVCSVDDDGDEESSRLKYSLLGKVCVRCGAHQNGRERAGR